MLAFLGGGLATVIVAVLVFVAMGLAIYKMIRDKREGKQSCSCGGSCGGCAGCSGCSGGCTHTGTDTHT